MERLEDLLGEASDLNSLQQRQVLAAISTCGTHGQLPFLIDYGERDLDTHLRGQFTEADYRGWIWTDSYRDRSAALGGRS